MKRFPISLLVLIIGVLVSVGQIVMLSPLLPPTVASHFGVDGHPDGFMTRSAFVASHWLLIGFLGTILIGLPLLIRVTPVSSINLPNKEYWLAPERKDVSLTFIADRMNAFGSATLALLAGTFQRVYEVNIHGDLKLGSSVLLLLGIYFVYLGIWTFGFVRHFRMPRF